MTRYSKIAYFKSRAKTVLFRNYPKVFVAFAAALFLISGFTVLTEYIYELLILIFDRVTAISFFVYYSVLCFLLAVPLLFLLVNFLISLNSKESGITKNIFLLPYGDYKTTLLISSVYFLILLSLCFFPMGFRAFTIYAVDSFQSSENYLFKIFLKILLSFLSLLLFCLFFSFSSSFLLLYRIFLTKKMSFSNLVKSSFSYMKNKKGDFVILNLSFLPLMFISYYVFPLFIFYFLPYYFFTADNFSKSCIENINSA